MARTGNFGRQPRSSPSITNTLIAIAREQQAREDQNIMDAWQKGGVVDGKEVTDDMVLKHWKQRLVDISKDDPLYDTYSNSVMQLEYSIAESKMTAKYALIPDPSSGQDMEMANFYLKWAKKVPKNSEFYRVLQRDAGQYIRAAKAKRATRQADNTEKNYQLQMAALEKKHERPGQEALRVITMLAQEGAVIGENPLGNASQIAQRSNLGTVQIGGVEQLMNLLANVMVEESVSKEIIPGVAGGPMMTVPGKSTANSQRLYTDENGKPVTGADLVARFKAIDPAFNGKFDLAYVQGAIASARDGIENRIKLARKTGHVAEAMALEYEQAKVNEFSRQVDAYPVVAEYNDLNAKVQAVISDNSLLPEAKGPAIEKLRGEIGKLAADPRIAADTRMQAQLRAEATGQVGVPTLAEDPSGEKVGYSDGISDNKVVNDHLALFAEQKARVDSGEAVYTQGFYQKDEMTGKMKFVPSTNGPMVGAATMAEINNLPGVGKPVPVMVPNGDGGGATPMYVMPSPIRVNAQNTDGSQMSATNQNEAGSFISYMFNGKPVTLYSITRGGTQEWTTDPPWDPDLVKVDQANGVMNVTLLKVPDFNTTNLQANGQLAAFPGFEVQGAKQNEDGSWTNGEIRFNPQAAVYATDMARVHAGSDPFTDSFSASLAAVKESPDGPRLLQQWTGDERFNFILDHNAHMAAGQSFNGQTGQWEGGDPAAYSRNLSSAQRAIRAAKSGKFTADNMSDWRRDTTDALVPDAAQSIVNRNAYTTVSPMAQGIVGMLDKYGEKRLPSDAIKEPESRFKALGFGFIPGTNQLANPGKVADDRLTLTTGLNLRVPAVEPWTPKPADIPKPMSSTATPKPYGWPTSTPPPSTSDKQPPYGGPGPNVPPAKYKDLL